MYLEARSLPLVPPPGKVASPQIAGARNSEIEAHPAGRAETVDEVLDVRDQAKAAEAYARSAHLKP